MSLLLNTESVVSITVFDTWQMVNNNYIKYYKYYIKYDIHYITYNIIYNIYEHKTLLTGS